MIWWLAGLWLGCGGSAVTCDSPSAVLSESESAGSSLTCRQADWIVDYWELLRAAPLAVGDRRLARKAVVGRFDDDPERTLALLDEVRADGRRLLGLRGSEAAGARSRIVYEARAGEGIVRGGELGRLQRKLLPVWGSSEEARISLTEADVEAWIRFASLCREVQGGSPLRISVAGRVGVYRAVQERFDEGSVDVQRALASLGPAWLQIRRAWIRASWAEQQAWMAEAPLPGPMTANSADYARAIIAGDVAGHVRTLAEHFGPFTLATDRPMFPSEDPASE